MTAVELLETAVSVIFAATLLMATLMMGFGLYIQLNKKPNNIKYYFISYVGQNIERKVHHFNNVIDKHPLAWQVEQIKKFEAPEQWSYFIQLPPTLTFWVEISKDEYDEYYSKLEQ